MARLSAKQWLGFLAGMAVTSSSLSSGFIWACGTPCIQTAYLWTPARQEYLVFGAALSAWWGYLFSHYMVTGTFIDESAYTADRAGTSVAEQRRSEPPLIQQLGVLAGIGLLVAGIVIGVVYIRQGNHLLTNLGGVFFLGGYAIAHYVETGKPV